MKLPDWLYELIKKLLTLIFPALGSLVIGLAKVWELDIPSQQINETITLICGFLCVVFNIGVYTYNKDKEKLEDPEQ